MRWRTTAAEEMQQTVGGGGATTTVTKTTKNNNQQKVWRQRWRRCAVAEAEDDNGWQETEHSGGGGGATVVRWQRKNNAMEDGAEVEDGWDGTGQCAHFFSFLGRVEYYLQSYPLQSFQKRGVIFGILGDVFATIEVGLGLVELGVGLGVILWSFLVILPPILP